MIDTPNLPIFTVALAVVMLGDALVSIRPPGFIRTNLTTVGLPRDWWWILIAIKVLAGVGLLAGLHYPGVAFSANVGVVAFFVCAAYSHIRVKDFGPVFWINCLGLLGFSAAVLIVSNM